MWITESNPQSQGSIFLFHWVISIEVLCRPHDLKMKPVGAYYVKIKTKEKSPRQLAFYLFIFLQSYLLEWKIQNGFLYGAKYPIDLCVFWIDKYFGNAQTQLTVMFVPWNWEIWFIFTLFASFKHVPEDEPVNKFLPLMNFLTFG